MKHAKPSSSSLTQLYRNNLSFSACERTLINLNFFFECTPCSLICFKDQEYHTLEELYKALKERNVIGALIDTYNGGSNKDMFDTEHLRVNKILDYSSTYGVVMGKEARKLRMCFKDYIQHAFANEISHHIQKNTEQSKVSKSSHCF